MAYRRGLPAADTAHVLSRVGPPQIDRGTPREVQNKMCGGGTPEPGNQATKESRQKQEEGRGGEAGRQHKVRS